MIRGALDFFCKSFVCVYTYKYFSFSFFKTDFDTCFLKGMKVIMILQELMWLILGGFIFVLQKCLEFMNCIEALHLSKFLIVIDLLLMALLYSSIVEEFIHLVL